MHVLSIRIFFFFKGSLRLIDVRKTKMLKTITDRLQGSEGIKPVSQFSFRYDKSILHLKVSLSLPDRL